MPVTPWEIDRSAVDALEVLRLAEQALTFQNGRRCGSLHSLTCTQALAMFSRRSTSLVPGTVTGSSRTAVRLEEVRLGSRRGLSSRRLLDLGGLG